MRNRKAFCKLGRWLRFAFLAGLLWLVPPAAAELRLPTLHTRRGIYTNVVVTSKTERDLYIRHDGGIGNVKLDDVEDNNALIALGLRAAPVKVEVIELETNTPITSSVTNAPAKKEVPKKGYRAQAFAKLQELRKLFPPVSVTVLSVILGTLFGFYLFGCFCLKLVCEKAGAEPSLLVWLPLLQLIPAYRAAGMSGWWGALALPPFLGLINPQELDIVTAVVLVLVMLMNLVGQIMWCFKITSARGKSIWVAVLLLVPGFSVFAFLYLAFSSADE